MVDANALATVRAAVGRPILSPPRQEPGMTQRVSIKAENVDFYYGKVRALKNINIEMFEKKVTAIIGPSGCGKSTFIRLLNRMDEMVPNTRLTGRISINEMDLFAASVDPVEIRRRVGMVFQKPNSSQSLILPMYICRTCSNDNVFTAFTELT